jgi:FkbM family methyltransferase
MRFIFDLLVLLITTNPKKIRRAFVILNKYAGYFSVISTHLYERLPSEQRKRFLVWFLKRWGKLDIVDPVELGTYRATMKRFMDEPRPIVALEGKRYFLRNFKNQGHSFELLGYDWFTGVHDIFYNQYEDEEFKLRDGEVIIDAGAFIGDTAVLFYKKLGGQCEHSFEVLEENITLFDYNIRHNGLDRERVHLNRLALTEQSGQKIHINTSGFEGSTKISGASGVGPVVSSITIDDYVAEKGLEKINLIKMDIEGAERTALLGSKQTIVNYRPKLAVCLYHLWDDVIEIPKIIDAIGVRYQYRFKWVQLNDGWEAVLLASPAEADEGSTKSKAAIEDGRY